MSIGEDRPTVHSDFHMLDLNDNFFSAPFTANIRPSARYGHASASNLIPAKEEDYLHQLCIIGGLDI